VFSFINRFVWMLRISGGKSAIAFLQPRDRFGRRNNWLIEISRISSAGKFACDNQAGDDEAGYELSFYHTGDLKADVACSFNSKLRSERRRTSMSCRKI